MLVNRLIIMARPGTMLSNPANTMRPWLTYQIASTDHDKLPQATLSTYLVPTYTILTLTVTYRLQLGD